MNDYEFERFMAKVDLTLRCWLWTGTTSRGYGYITVGKCTDGSRRTTTAHRLAYEHFVEPIPDGLHVDHLCRVRNCVNPAHLEPVTCKENCQRGLKGRLLTHCPRGHPYDEVNTALRPDGRRGCRTCHRDRMAAKYAAGYIAPSRR